MKERVTFLLGWLVTVKQDRRDFKQQKFVSHERHLIPRGNCRENGSKTGFVAPKLKLSFCGNKTVLSVPYTKHDRISRGQRHAFLKL